MSWWQNDPVAPPAMDAAKATASWWRNDPIAKKGLSEADLTDGERAQVDLHQKSSGIYRNIPIIGGALDEIGAAADAAVSRVVEGKPYGEAYDRALEVRRLAERKRQEAAGPVMNTVDAIGGAVAAAPAMPFVRFARNPETIMGSATNAALNAAPVAALSAFTEAEGGVRNRVDAAAKAIPMALATGAVVGGAVQGRANRLAGTRQDSVARAADNIGVTVPAFMDGGRTSQNMAAKLGGIPFVGDDVHIAVNQTRRGVSDAADHAATFVSNGTHIQQAGENARGAMTDWAGDGARAIQDRVFAPVNRAMQNVAAPLNNTRQAAAELARQQNVAASPIHNRALGEVGNALNQPNGLSFEGMTRLRTRIGTMMDNTVDPENRTAAAGLRAIYAGLSRDMEDAIAQNGGNGARRLWERANRVTQQIAERRDTIARIIGHDGDKTGESIVDKIVTMASTKSTADAARLTQARRVIGADAWNGIAGNAIMRLGRNQSNEFSPDIFLKNYRQLSDSGRNLLFRSQHNGGLYNALESLAAVSERLQRFSRLGNPSGSGGVAALLAALGGAASGDMGATLATAVGGRGVGILMSRPAVVRNATAHAANMARAINGRISQAALSASAAKLAASVAVETGEDKETIMARIGSVKAN